MADALNLVFDLDGTLVHSLPSISAAVNKVLTNNGFSQVPESLVGGLVGNGAAVLVGRLLVHLGQDPSGQLRDRMLGELIETYEATHDLSSLYPGTALALAELAIAGHRLAICTNKPRKPARAVLHHFGLLQFFSAIIGGDSLLVLKPDPAPLLAAMEALGPGRTIFIGDSEVDAETARATGVPFALFSGGYRKASAESLGAKLIFDHHAALPQLIAHLAAKL